MTPTTQMADLGAIKARQRAAWAAGDYAQIGTTLQITGELLCEAVDVAAGHRVLDVAAGNGNASLAAARRGCDVIATDYVGSLLDGLCARARADGVHIDRREADAEDLPFADATFDVVLSTFGVMFAADQERAAAELQRVCRPGGRIGLANWTPEGFVGQMFRVVARYAPPPPGVVSPLRWGTEEGLARLLSDTAAIDVTERSFVFRYRNAFEWAETFRTLYGPINRVHASLPAREGMEFFTELVELAESHNVSHDGTLRVPGSYLQVVASMPVLNP
jgi:SAM-dependent methyltransferase